MQRIILGISRGTIFDFLAEAAYCCSETGLLKFREASFLIFVPKQHTVSQLHTDFQSDSLSAGTENMYTTVYIIL
jgi:hypothetical protein